ncbi:hypothetical protein PENTCL1PPCAC_24170, partial [Pristionchus entomophagus]
DYQQPIVTLGQRIQREFWTIHWTSLFSLTFLAFPAIQIVMTYSTYAMVGLTLIGIFCGDSAFRFSSEYVPIGFNMPIASLLMLNDRFKYKLSLEEGQ